MGKIIDTDFVIADIIRKYSSYGTETNRIEQAYKFAQKAHQGVLRKSGEPYINHPVCAARELMAIQPDMTTIVACLLHDTVTDGSGDLKEIESLFGKEVRVIIEALDKIGLIKYRGNASTIERLQRTLIAMSSDVRSIFVKFADRIDNLGTLQYHADPKKSKRIADESISIYAPIAARLGLYSMKETMETLALRELDFGGYLHITGELAHYTLEQEQFLTKIVSDVVHILPEKFQKNVTYRIKKPYSIYHKLKQKGLKNIADIYDVFALKIKVDDVADCYSVLGLIHGHFTPLTDRFKDYIAVPKANGYQSLHTTVLGFLGYKHPIEIQIRTHEMDVIAEGGNASHVLYKFYGKNNTATHEDLVQTTLDTLIHQGSLFGSKITFPTLFVFSPKGDVFELPHRATPLDFAYAVHSDVGYHTVGARVNGKIVTLDTHLVDGDVVEILTSTQAHPVEQWLDFVVSSKAKTHIDVEVKRLSGVRARIVARGRQNLLDTFRQAGIELDENFVNFTQYYGSPLEGKKLEEFLYHIGQGVRKPSSFLPFHTKVKKNPTIINIPKSQIIIGGEKNIPYELALCCKPEFPTNIVALTRSSGKCMIHSISCGNLSRSNPRRLLHAFWQTGDGNQVIAFSLLFHDRDDLLNDLTTILYDMKVTILDLNLSKVEHEITTIYVTLKIPLHDTSFLTRCIERIRLSIPEFLSWSENFFDKKK